MGLTSRCTFANRGNHFSSASKCDWRISIILWIAQKVQKLLVHRLIIFQSAGAKGIFIALGNLSFSNCEIKIVA